MALPSRTSVRKPPPVNCCIGVMIVLSLARPRGAAVATNLIEIRDRLLSPLGCVTRLERELFRDGLMPPGVDLSCQCFPFFPHGRRPRGPIAIMRDDLLPQRP